jgi:metal-dependent hydrolase (beta-lactamase superfamily II)
LVATSDAHPVPDGLLACPIFHNQLGRQVPHIESGTKSEIHELVGGLHLVEVIQRPLARAEVRLGDI